jgi:hypothetical protein
MTHMMAGYAAGIQDNHSSSIINALLTQEAVARNMLLPVLNMNNICKATTLILFLLHYVMLTHKDIVRSNT